MNTKLHLAAVATASMLALAGCATTSDGYATMPPPVGSSTACYDCGVVTRIETVSGTQRSGTTGAVIGGLVGAAAGHQIADDSSKGRQNVATVAGAAAGAVAGAAIQRNMGNDATYAVYVRMDDGRTTMVTQSDLGNVREGSRVRVYNGRVWGY